jgi:hypothetical protein
MDPKTPQKGLFYLAKKRGAWKGDFGGKIAVYQLSGWYFINVSPCLVEAASHAFNPYLPVSIWNVFHRFQRLSSSRWISKHSKKGFLPLQKEGAVKGDFGGKIAVCQLTAWYFINVSPCLVEAAIHAF